MKKGDYVVYAYGGDIVEAKVLREYENGYIKVRHTGQWFFAFTHIISKGRVLGSNNNYRGPIVTKGE